MVLVAGGEDSNGNALASAELYDPSTGSFTLNDSLNTARILHTATLLNNGTDLMAGGYGSSAYLTAAELDDPATGTFSPTGSLNIGRYLHTASLLNNGMNLVAGGHNSSGYLASAELYEPATLTPPNLVSISVSPSSPTVPLDTGAAVDRHGHLQRRQHGAARFGDLELLKPRGRRHHRRCQQHGCGLCPGQGRHGNGECVCGLGVRLDNGDGWAAGAGLHRGHSGKRDDPGRRVVTFCCHGDIQR